MKIVHFTFNAFSENTYLLIAEDKTCIITDPGMMNTVEEKVFFGFIEKEGLQPKRVINTHCHIDHVLGIQAVYSRFGLKPELTKEEEVVFKSCVRVADMYGVPYLPYSGELKFINYNDKVHLGAEEIELRFVPGHAPGHIILIHHASKSVIAGDTLFRESIGRTDLPGGDHETLLKSIKTEIYSLDDDYTIWPGHGPETTVGHEKKHNPFVKG